MVQEIEATSPGQNAYENNSATVSDCLPTTYTMHETTLRFELPPNHTLVFSGSQTVAVKTCRAEKQSFTIVLAVAADRAKVTLG